MKRTWALEVFGWWLLLASVWAFVLFGLDKLRAKRDRTNRISQFSLLMVSALGGWIGGLLGILVFRHKSAKFSFLGQFFLALIVFVFLVVAALKYSGEL